MFRLPSLCLVTAFCLVATFPVFAAESDPEPFIGEYEGSIHFLGHDDLSATACVVSEGPALYRACIRFTNLASKPDSIELHGLAEGPRINFSTICQGVRWVAELMGEDLTGKRDDGYGVEFAFKRVFRKSPTEAAAPPEGAVVLIPFKEGTPPDMSAWQNCGWEPQEDGSVRVKAGSGSIMTKDSFGSCRIHLEFNIPHMPLAAGQGRANSGCYIQNRFEVQVLDSFGVLSGAGDCGALYQISAPRVNANLPPTYWQTYDIEFHAPKYNADGSIKENARITVELNGIKVQDNLEIPKATPGGMPLDNGQERGPFLLQDHSNPVRYRNFWVVPIND